MLTVDVSIVDGAGVPVAAIEGLRAVRTGAEALVRSTAVPSEALPSPAEELLYELAWRPASPATDAPPHGPWLVVADAAGVGDGVADVLRSAGADCTVVSAGDSLTAASVRDLVVEHAVREVVYLRGLDTVPLRSGGDVVAEQRHGLGGALVVVQGLAEAPARLWLVTRGAQAVDGPARAPEQAPLTGLGAAVRAERPELRCVTLDVDPDPDADAVAAVLTAVAAGDDDELVAIRGADRLVARLVHLDIERVLDGPTRLASSSYGVLDGLHLVPAGRREPGPGEVEVEVAVTGLNFRDVLVALDLYPQRSTVFGDECAGVVVAAGPGVAHLRVGERVVALAPGAFATHVTTPAVLTFPVPEEIDLEAAATIPIPFLTAQYALVRLGHLRAGERVLIHAGAGGVGMAAIQLAQRIGAEVYATAGSPQKRAVLEALGVEHVFDSRSLDFADGVLAATGGQGVHVVLNSLAGDFIRRSVDVLAPGGRFLEIGRRDVWTPEQMASERPDVDYHIVFLGDVSSNDPAAIQAMFAELLPRVRGRRPPAAAAHGLRGTRRGRRLPFHGPSAPRRQDRGPPGASGRLTRRHLPDHGWHRRDRPPHRSPPRRAGRPFDRTRRAHGAGRPLPQRRSTTCGGWAPTSGSTPPTSGGATRSPPCLPSSSGSRGGCAGSSTPPASPTTPSSTSRRGGTSSGRSDQNWPVPGTCTS